MKKVVSLLLLGMLMLLSTRLSAQETITTDALAKNVSGYYVQNYDTSAVVYNAENQRYAPDASSLENRHSLQVGGGLPGLTTVALLDMFVKDEDRIPLTTLSDRLHDARYYWSKERAVTSLALDYGYRLRDGLSLGVKGAVGFTTRSRRHRATNEVLYRDNRVVASLLFNMRFDWLHRRSFMMYSSFGVGLTSIFDYYDGMIVPMFDATYVGFTLGRKCYYFLEIGGGASGTVRTGIGCRF